MTSGDGADVAGQPLACLFCGEPERFEIAEIWSTHEFMIECCCEGLHESVVREMADDPAWAKTLLRRAGIEALAGHRLRRLADDGCCGMLLDWQLQRRPIAFADARAFVARHHAHCGPPTAARFQAAIFNGSTLVGVGIVGNPVARAYNGRFILEVNRLCIRRDVPRALAWNAASMLYGWAAREASRQGWSKIITYTRTDEDGTSLIASGWAPEKRVRGRGWHGGKRARSNTNGWIDKIRWSKALADATRPATDRLPRPPERQDAPLTEALFDAGAHTASRDY